jgi:predicted small integral membrane protein
MTAAFASIVAAVLVTMIALGVQRPHKNPKVEVTRSTSLYRAFLAVTDIVFAYGKPLFIDCSWTIDQQRQPPIQPFLATFPR